jgi:hypothetical protein
VQLLQCVIDLHTLVEEVNWDRDLPFDLTNTGSDIVCYGEPFSTDKVEKSLDG